MEYEFDSGTLISSFKIWKQQKTGSFTFEDFVRSSGQISRGPVTIGVRSSLAEGAAGELHQFDIYDEIFCGAVSIHRHNEGTPYLCPTPF